MAEEFHDVLPVSQLPNRAVIGMRLSLPDGRIFEGRDQDGTGCGAWVYIADIVTSMQYRVMEIDREWSPKWLCETAALSTTSARSRNYAAPPSRKSRISFATRRRGKNQMSMKMNSSW